MDDFWYDISQLWVGTFFYGIYLVLFCICVYILLHRPHSRANTVLLATAIALFTLSTVLTVLNLVLGAAEIDDIDSIPSENIQNAAMIIYGVNNSIADSLIYRCYVIWNKNWRVIIVPIMMLITSTVFGLDFTLSPYPFFGLTLATNVLVTALTAGRIRWICRQSRAYLKVADQRRYASSVAILVESGMVYSAAILTYLVVISIPGLVNTLGEPILQMLAQVMGIAPTLIIVRVGLGVSVENLESTVRTAQATSTSFLGSRLTQPDFNENVTVVFPDVEKGQFDHGSESGWSR
ncbi:hypothetical protein MVEN_00703900 [Mycena venus]|uniref:Uncharacterized protein n=1 Tax=Mycena venus TaxID=2733690 RepID=A0A8H7D5Q2_9AGAR|nr:hypothetical protein MVEN_00703900 [Mycena venus]